ncbi:coiled-coil domain-containing protein 159 isoform X2 [Ascaphus truei]|uniref:coiled-coil domain-containing protein 159 isoform X2 n=1 Tax=Ascaphus truei TaxID=8439 RepID=UPI003F5A2558
MNWDTQLDSILTATDSNMAKIKERLYSRDLAQRERHFDFPNGKTTLYEDAPTKPDVPCASCVRSFNSGVSSEDIVDMSSQLLSQAKMIASLHQAIGRLDRDREYQQHRMQSLEEEMCRLRGLQGDVCDSVLEKKVQGLRQELSDQLRHLREKARDPLEQSPGQRCTASIIQEVNENKRLLWKEYESLRKDIDYLHQRLRRQEDDMLRQLSEGQEVKRAQDRNAKVLEGLLSSHHTQTVELNRTRSETQGVQRDLLQIRSMIGDINEDVRILEGKVYAHSVGKDRTERAKPTVRKKKSIRSSSSGEDTASQISLGDISSEDTSYSLDVPAPSYGSRDQSSASRGVGSRDKTRSSLNVDDFSDDLDGLPDSPPELNFSDL